MTETIVNSISAKSRIPGKVSARLDVSRLNVVVCSPVVCWRSVVDEMSLNKLL